MAAAVFPAAVFAQDEHQRRLAAELLIMRGDLARFSTPDLPEARREGLRARLAGALSSLPWLLRLAGASPEPAQAARDRYFQGDFRILAADLDALIARHPLDMAGIAPVSTTPASVAYGRAIHEEACAGCHDAPNQPSPLPAEDLRLEVERMPLDEFAARLINGIRGDHTTALANPFGNAAISALISFYRH